MKLPVLVTGIGVGASGLILAAGIGLVVHSSQASVARDAALDEKLACDQAPCLRDEAAARARVDAEVARMRESLRTQIRAHELAREEMAFRARPLRAQIEEEVEPQIALAADGPEETIADGMRPVRQAVLTGDLETIRAAVARHNAAGGTPIVLGDDPSLQERGITLRARYNRRASDFSVTLEASEADGGAPCTVLVAPGSIVKAGSSGDQDTAPIQARFLDVKPRKHVEAPATICCAAIHLSDPRSGTPRGIVRHPDARLAKVAAAAERTHADWGAAQVAVWAVANDVTEPEVAQAPGEYSDYIASARDVLEAAGIDTNKLPLYAHAAPLGRRSALGVDFDGRFAMPRGG